MQIHVEQFTKKKQQKQKLDIKIGLNFLVGGGGGGGCERMIIRKMYDFPFLQFCSKYLKKFKKKKVIYSMKAYQF